MQAYGHARRHGPVGGEEGGALGDSSPSRAHHGPESEVVGWKMTKEDVAGGARECFICPVRRGRNNTAETRGNAFIDEMPRPSTYFFVRGLSLSLVSR
jgi:hypothetical protein